MKAVIFLLICCILEFSISVPIDENVSNEKTQSEISSQSESNFNGQKLESGDEGFGSEVKSFAANKTEYIFLCDLNGISFVIDSATYKVINSYYLPEVAFALIAVVGDKFYKIHTRNGTIYSTAVKNLLQGQNGIIWEHAGSFPSEDNYLVRESNTVDGSRIFFVTYTGNIYLYDTISRQVLKKGVAPGNSSYASLVVNRDIVYIFKHEFFYSLNDSKITLIKTQDTRVGAALLKAKDYVCIVGGNSTETYRNVQFYDTTRKKWKFTTKINEARRFPGVAATESQTYIFGGLADFYSPNMTSFWRNSIEVLHRGTGIWEFHFAPTPLTGKHEYIEAVIFYN